MDLLICVLLNLLSFFLIINGKERYNIHRASMPMRRKFFVEFLCHLLYQSLFLIWLELLG